MHFEGDRRAQGLAANLVLQLLRCGDRATVHGKDDISRFQIRTGR
jgi:hypothetical protein